MTIRFNKKKQPALQWYTSDKLKVPHAMFTRHGGKSTPPYTGLNIGHTTGDTHAIVQENILLTRVIVPRRFLVSAQQIHGDQVTIVKHIDQDTLCQPADALITNQPGVALLIQQADCQALLLHDPKNNIIAAIHSGWRGSTLNIIGKTVATMQNAFNVNPRHLIAVISPSLGPCCAEFIHFQDELPPSFHVWQRRPSYFDFWSISKDQLIQAGVAEEHIETTAICTTCNDNFFSYRRAVREGNPVTGRNGSFIALPE